jgi:hypothetical protein
MAHAKAWIDVHGSALSVSPYLNDGLAQAGLVPYHCRIVRYVHERTEDQVIRDLLAAAVNLLETADALISVRRLEIVKHPRATRAFRNTVDNHVPVERGSEVDRNLGV